MAKYTLFFHPMSRAQIAHWALLEADADFEFVEIDWENKPAALLEANAMGKLPTLIHHHGEHDHVVTEAAAVCHYIAEVEDRDLLPREEERADYFRWLMFAAGPLEQAVTAKGMGWETPEGREGMVGFGDYDRTIDALDGWLANRDYVCGDRFTMADVYVGSGIGYGMAFGNIAPRDSFSAYMARLSEREGYKASLGTLGD